MLDFFFQTLVVSCSEALVLKDLSKKILSKYRVISFVEEPDRFLVRTT
jgi:hypothetical protein